VVVDDGGGVFVGGVVDIRQDAGGGVAGHGGDAIGCDDGAEGEIDDGVGAGDAACAGVNLHPRRRVEVDGQFGRRDARFHPDDDDGDADGDVDGDLGK